MSELRINNLIYDNLAQAWLLALALCLMSASLLWCLDYPLLSFVFIITMISVPVIVIRGIAKVASGRIAYLSTAAIWMSGIVQFIAAGLICSLLTDLYLTLHPSFLTTFFHKAITSLYEAQGTLPSQMPTLEHLDVPNPMQYVGSMFWATSFFGSVFSLFAGLLLPRISAFTRYSTRFTRFYK